MIGAVLSDLLTLLGIALLAVLFIALLAPLEALGWYAGWRQRRAYQRRAGGRAAPAARRRPRRCRSRSTTSSSSPASATPRRSGTTRRRRSSCAGCGSACRGGRDRRPVRLLGHRRGHRDHRPAAPDRRHVELDREDGAGQPVRPHRGADQPAQPVPGDGLRRPPLRALLQPGAGGERARRPARPRLPAGQRAGHRPDRLQRRGAGLPRARRLPEAHAGGAGDGDLRRRGDVQRGQLPARAAPLPPVGHQGPHPAARRPGLLRALAAGLQVGLEPGPAPGQDHPAGDGPGGPQRLGRLLRARAAAGRAPPDRPDPGGDPPSSPPGPHRRRPARPPSPAPAPAQALAPGPGRQRGDGPAEAARTRAGSAPGAASEQ